MPKHLLATRIGMMLCALIACASPALASDVIVPDDYATITQAIASGADSVSVRPGTYPEALSIDRALVLRGLCSGGTWGAECALTDRPVIMSVEVTAGGSQLLNLHVTGHAAVSCLYSQASVLGCQFDAGFSYSGGGLCDVDSCQVFGNLTVWCGPRSEISMNTVTGGTLFAGGSVGTFVVHDNVVVGPASLGILADEDCVVRNNYVRGCTVGIQAMPGSYITGNVVEDCTETGYASSGAGQPPFNQNVARRWGYRGFDLAGVGGEVSGNLVDSTGQEGIVARAPGSPGGFGGLNECTDNTVLHAGADGIAVWLVTGKLSGNRVLGAGGDGISISGRAAEVSGNVVGRSQGGGIVFHNALEGPFRVHNNTVFANGGVGIDLSGDSAAGVDSVTNNIALGNAIGLRWAGAAVPTLACNDWFGNVTARVVGTAPSAADTTLDPLFCDLAHDIVSLSSVSPLASLAGCGQVGAQGVGCAYPVSVVAGPAQLVGRLRVSPQPGRGPIQFSWQPSTGPGHLDIYDLSGARRWSSLFAQDQNTLQWSGAGHDGRPLSAGVYFARLQQNGSRSEARVVILK